jgi:hypothetical protein
MLPSADMRNRRKPSDTWAGLVLAAALLVSACGTSDAGSGGRQGGGGMPTSAGADASAASSSGGSSGASATGGDGGRAQEDGPVPPLGGSGGDEGPAEGGAVSDPGCASALATEPCTGDARCDFVEECQSGFCVCLDGNWACSSRNTCSATCGVPQDSQCGGECSAPARGCLCAQGGGPDFVGCDCVDGTWDCRG